MQDNTQKGKKTGLTERENFVLSRMIADLTSRNIPVSPETILDTLSALGWNVNEEERPIKLEAIRKGIEHLKREGERLQNDIQKENARIAALLEENKKYS